MDAVVWATGHRADYSWIYALVFDQRGVPIHRRGVTESQVCTSWECTTSTRGARPLSAGCIRTRLTSWTGSAPPPRRSATSLTSSNERQRPSQHTVPPCSFGEDDAAQCNARNQVGRVPAPEEDGAPFRRSCRPPFSDRLSPLERPGVSTLTPDETARPCYARI